MYVKLIDDKIEEAPINKDGICNYNLDVERMTADGYKLLIPAQVPPSTEIRMYHFEYVENIDNITEVVVYDETHKEAEDRLKNQREKQFKGDFFQTSLGYIRRSVSMQEGENKDFLSDLLPSIAIAANSGIPVTILAYDKPDFTHDIEDWTIYQHQETVTMQFIQECFTQLQNDFLPIN